ncbi:peptide-methionine (S)-S-oxide reductase MsrA [Bacillus sp. 2205SS5-2]|uniref:peptide-methionine (S)-S-oxide reductase MsrA n=1 Tax=Bacillus sp. 2205SS5-2 TaxID=3109031 RepID=UPI003005C291
MSNQQVEIATFAGGCFWCMVKPFDEQPGIISIVSGYTGGDLKNPTYEQVCTNKTGHYEAVQITFDSTIYPYETLLKQYWQQIDPTDAGGQFFDRGQSYQTAIFYHTDEQQQQAEKSKEKLAESGVFKKPIVTSILPAKPFYPAEAYHQGYYKRNVRHYASYFEGSGRKNFIQLHWGDKNESEE